MLKVLSHVYHDSVLSRLRSYISSLSVMGVRVRLLKLLELITDLLFLPDRLLESGTPSLLLIQNGVIDVIYSQSRGRPGKSTS